MTNVTYTPLEIAKGMWNHALGEDRKRGVYTYRDSKIYNYYGILAMFAAGQFADFVKDEEWLEEIKGMLKRYPEEFFTAPDLFFKCSFDNYICGGIAKSWMVLNGYFEDHKEYLREYAEKILAQPHDRDGIICDRSYPEMERIWIDVVYAVTPYMLHTGLVLNEQRYIDYACEQCFKMYDLLLDKECGLLHQSRGFMADVKAISEDHWSRGNGWGYIGLTELVRYLPKTDKNYEGAVRRFVDLSKAIAKYQSKKGLWKQEMTEKYSWEESSGTGLFLYGIGVGMRHGLLDKEEFMPVFEKGIKALTCFCLEDDFATQGTCCGFLTRAIFPEDNGTIYAYICDGVPVKDEGHSFGAFILAYLEAAKLDITDLNWNYAKRSI
ncbi:MAG: glycoside hydrolase family 88 protein [Clostridia bacterium]|nr:glycoside hydrolase family 88 protein [Clostridia bacterium]